MATNFFDSRFYVKGGLAVHNRRTSKSMQSVVEFFKTFLKDKRQMAEQGKEEKQGINLRAIIWQLCYDDL
jgi:hypothetical protein